MAPHIPVPKTLLASGYNAYSDENAARKESLHRDGKTFLKQIATPSA